jgi:hypothetical protein
MLQFSVMLCLTHKIPDTLMQTFLDSVPLAKEKLIDQQPLRIA